MSVDFKVKQAHKAFLASYSNDNLQKRAGWLEAIGEALEHWREDLVTVAQTDTHLPEARLNNELTRTVFQLMLLAEEVRRGDYLDVTVDHQDPDWGMGPRPDIRRMNVALGVVGVFGASNFPFAFSIAGGDSASALAAGCSVVHKIHEGHEALGLLTAEIVAKALSTAGAPQGIFATLTGRDAGIELVEHPLVKAVGFTGSVTGGRALFDRAVSRPEPIPFFGELGSINPAIVTEAAWNARPDDIIDGFLQSLTMGIGQFCTKPGVLFLPASVADAAKSKLIEKLRLHEPEGKMLNERIYQGFLESRGYVASLSGVETITAGDDSNPPMPAMFAAATQGLGKNAAVLQTEMFGPAGAVLSYNDQQELLNAIDELPGQLTGTIQSEADENIDDLMRTLGLRCGRLLRNQWPTGVTVSYAQSHGGPYPATTATNSTSVGTAAISRFVRPVAFQNFDETELPSELKESNPLELRRRVDGEWNRH